MAEPLREELFLRLPLVVRPLKHYFRFSPSHILTGLGAQAVFARKENKAKCNLSQIPTFIVENFVQLSINLLYVAEPTICFARAALKSFLKPGFHAVCTYVIQAQCRDWYRLFFGIIPKIIPNKQNNKKGSTLYDMEVMSV